MAKTDAVGDSRRDVRAEFARRHRIHGGSNPQKVYDDVIGSVTPGLMEFMAGVDDMGTMFDRVAEAGERYGADAVMSLTFVTSTELAQLLQMEVGAVWAWASRDRYAYPEALVSMPYRGFNWSIWCVEGQILPWMWSRGRLWRQRVQKLFGGLVLDAGGDEEDVAVAVISWAHHLPKID